MNVRSIPVEVNIHQDWIKIRNLRCKPYVRHCWTSSDEWHNPYGRSCDVKSLRSKFRIFIDAWNMLDEQINCWRCLCYFNLCARHHYKNKLQTIIFKEWLKKKTFDYFFYLSSIYPLCSSFLHRYFFPLPYLWEVDFCPDFTICRVFMAPPHPYPVKLIPSCVRQSNLC